LDAPLSLGSFDPGTELEFALDRAGGFVTYREFSGDHVALAYEDGGGATNFVEDRCVDPTVGNARRAVKSIRDTVSRQYAFSFTAKG